MKRERALLESVHKCGFTSGIAMVSLVRSGCLIDSPKNAKMRKCKGVGPIFGFVGFVGVLRGG